MSCIYNLFLHSFKVYPGFDFLRTLTKFAAIYPNLTLIQAQLTLRYLVLREIKLERLRMQRKIFGSWTEEVTWGWRRVHAEKLSIICASTNASA
jgi:hypothetical protein